MNTFRADVSDGTFANVALSRTQINFLVALFRGQTVQINSSGQFVGQISDRGVNAAITQKVNQFFAACGLSFVAGADSTFGRMQNFFGERILDTETDSEALERLLRSFNSASEFATFKKLIELNFKSSGKSFDGLLASEESGRTLGRLRGIVKTIEKGGLGYYKNKAYGHLATKSPAVNEMLASVKAAEAGHAASQTELKNQVDQFRTHCQNKLKSEFYREHLKLSDAQINNIKDVRILSALIAATLTLVRIGGIRDLLGHYNLGDDAVGSVAEAFRQDQNTDFFDLETRRFTGVLDGILAKARAGTLAADHLTTLNNQMGAVYREVDIVKVQETQGMQDVEQNAVAAEFGTYMVIGAVATLYTGGLVSGAVAGTMATGSSVFGSMLAGSLSGAGLTATGSGMIAGVAAGTSAETTVRTVARSVKNEEITGETILEDGRAAYSNSVNTALSLGSGALASRAIQTGLVTTRVTTTTSQAVLRGALTNSINSSAVAFVGADAGFGLDDLMLSGSSGALGGRLEPFLRGSRILETGAEALREFGENLAQTQFTLDGTGNITGEVLINAGAGAFTEIGGSMIKPGFAGRQKQTPTSQQAPVTQSDSLDSRKTVVQPSQDAQTVAEGVDVEEDIIWEHVTREQIKSGEFDFEGRHYTVLETLPNQWGRLEYTCATSQDDEGNIHSLMFVSELLGHRVLIRHDPATERRALEEQIQNNQPAKDFLTVLGKSNVKMVASEAEGMAILRLASDARMPFEVALKYIPEQNAWFVHMAPDAILYRVKRGEVIRTLYRPREITNLHSRPTINQSQPFVQKWYYNIPTNNQRSHFLVRGIHRLLSNSFEGDVVTSSDAGGRLYDFVIFNSNGALRYRFALSLPWYADPNNEFPEGTEFCLASIHANPGPTVELRDVLLDVKDGDYLRPRTELRTVPQDDSLAQPQPRSDVPALDILFDTQTMGKLVGGDRRQVDASESIRNLRDFFATYPAGADDLAYFYQITKNAYSTVINSDGTATVQLENLPHDSKWVDGKWVAEMKRTVTGRLIANKKITLKNNVYEVFVLDAGGEQFALCLDENGRIVRDDDLTERLTLAKLLRDVNNPEWQSVADFFGTSTAKIIDGPVDQALLRGNQFVQRAVAQGFPFEISTRIVLNRDGPQVALSLGSAVSAKARDLPENQLIDRLVPIHSHPVHDTPYTNINEHLSSFSTGDIAIFNKLFGTDTRAMINSKTQFPKKIKPEIDKLLQRGMVVVSPFGGMLMRSQQRNGRPFYAFYHADCRGSRPIDQNILKSILKRRILNADVAWDESQWELNFITADEFKELTDIDLVFYPDAQFSGEIPRRFDVADVLTIGARVLATRGRTEREMLPSVSLTMLQGALGMMPSATPTPWSEKDQYPEGDPANDPGQVSDTGKSGDPLPAAYTQAQAVVAVQQNDQADAQLPATATRKIVFTSQAGQVLQSHDGRVARVNAETGSFTTRDAAIGLDVSVSSDKGVGYKDLNEDGALIVTLRDAVTGRPVQYQVSIDGMGGHGSGDKAMQIIQAALAEALASGVSPEEALQQAKAALDATPQSGSDALPDNAGAVLVVARVEINESGKRAVKFWSVGDARAVVLRDAADGEVMRTLDQSWVQLLRNNGTIKNDFEQRTHVRANLVMNSLMKNVNMQSDPNFSEHDLEEGDWVVLASDGLWDNFDVAEVYNLIRGATTAAEAQEILIKAATDKMTLHVQSVRANQALPLGSKLDNINVIVTRVGPNPEGEKVRPLTSLEDRASLLNEYDPANQRSKFSSKKRFNWTSDNPEDRIVEIKRQQDELARLHKEISGELNEVRADLKDYHVFQNHSQDGELNAQIQTLERQVRLIARLQADLEKFEQMATADARVLEDWDRSAEATAGSKSDAQTSPVAEVLEAPVQMEVIGDAGFSDVTDTTAILSVTTDPEAALRDDLRFATELLKQVEDRNEGLPADSSDWGPNLDELQTLESQVKMLQAELDSPSSTTSRSVSEIQAEVEICLTQLHDLEFKIAEQMSSSRQQTPEVTAELPSGHRISTPENNREVTAPFIRRPAPPKQDTIAPDILTDDDIDAVDTDLGPVSELVLDRMGAAISRLLLPDIETHIGLMAESMPAAFVLGNPVLSMRDWRASAGMPFYAADYHALIGFYQDRLDQMNPTNLTPAQRKIYDKATQALLAMNENLSARNQTTQSNPIVQPLLRDGHFVVAWPYSDRPAARARAAERPPRPAPTFSSAPTHDSENEVTQEILEPTESAEKTQETQTRRVESSGEGSPSVVEEIREK